MVMDEIYALYNVTVKSHMLLLIKYIGIIMRKCITDDNFVAIDYMFVALHSSHSSPNHQPKHSHKSQIGFIADFPH